MLAAEPLAGAAEAADHLVGGEQDAVLVDDPLDFRPIGLGRDDQAAGALHRFADERRDPFGPDFEDFLLELARACQAELRRREVAALAEPVGLVDVHDARQCAVRARAARAWASCRRATPRRWCCRDSHSSAK